MKSLGERVTYANPKQKGASRPLTTTSANPKAQPKSAVTKKIAGKGPKNAKTKKPKNSKPKSKPKTVEELDAEMADYFVPGSANAGAGAASNGTAQAAPTGEDLGMDEISVSLLIAIV